MNQVVKSSEMSLEATLSRRRLFKILAASSGALVTSAILPAEWVEPVVETGILPAHAQISEPI